MLWFLTKKSKYYMAYIKENKPDAKCDIKGGAAYPDISGTVEFYQLKDGVLLSVEISGLPHDTGSCSSKIFGFHIHEGKSCTGSAEDPFADAKGHYNPGGCKHPQHAGDLPPIFEMKGSAFMAFLDGRFAVKDVLGRTMIIHEKPDDFTTQPSGNSGNKIACGIIRKT